MQKNGRKKEIKEKDLPFINMCLRLSKSDLHKTEIKVRPEQIKRNYGSCSGAIIEEVIPRISQKKVTPHMIYIRTSEKSEEGPIIKYYCIGDCSKELPPNSGMNYFKSDATKIPEMIVLIDKAVQNLGNDPIVKDLKTAKKYLEQNR